MASPYPLDLAKTRYSYIERPNSTLVGLVCERVLSRNATARILDIGCGCGANATELRRRFPGAFIQGIEPNPSAAEFARAACSSVFEGSFQEWAAHAATQRFDAVVLSDVLEHIADPVAFLQQLMSFEGVKHATFVISVPNFGVWYNRIATLLGQFDYSWSGLRDRTHLRFYTRRSLEKLLDYCGLRLCAVKCTPSIVQSAAPILRRAFDQQVADGQHLALTESKAFAAYRKFVEPAETMLCSAWPRLLGFQLVVAAVATES